MRESPRRSFGKRAYRFYTSLETPSVPRGVTVMNPYTERPVQRYLKGFLNKYFDDDRPRIAMLGINPGRFGAGVTGITFTDPVALADACGIPNHLPRKRELSSIYVYDVIGRMGGPEEFYRHFFLSAVCPLGFTRKGINLNYYDDRKLEREVTPFIVSSIEQHLALGCRSDHVVILGRGDNARFFSRLNEKHGWFGEVHAVDHPRFIMQYRRRHLDEYLAQYASLLSAIE
ncbi:MAG: uracil-DNA glycosylase family protein [Gemmatimonadaceae bacterium]